MRAGFSLVEVLVALALFGLIGAAGAAVLVVGADNREAVSEASARLARLQRLDAILRADLGQVADRTVRDMDGRPAGPAFSGGDGEVLFAFVRSGWDNPGEAPRSGLQRVDYRLVDGRLERRGWPYPDGARPGEALILHDAVRSARVSFIGDGGVTAPTWSGGGARPLPGAVRLELDLADWGPVTLTVLAAAP